MDIALDKQFSCQKLYRPQMPGNPGKSQEGDENYAVFADEKAITCPKMGQVTTQAPIRRANPPCRYTVVA